MYTRHTSTSPRSTPAPPHGQACSHTILQAPSLWPRTVCFESCRRASAPRSLRPPPTVARQPLPQRRPSPRQRRQPRPARPRAPKPSGAAFRLASQAARGALCAARHSSSSHKRPKKGINTRSCRSRLTSRRPDADTVRSARQLARQCASDRNKFVPLAHRLPAPVVAPSVSNTPIKQQPPHTPRAKSAN
jgi:hypothetical protein